MHMIHGHGIKFSATGHHGPCQRRAAPNHRSIRPQSSWHRSGNSYSRWGKGLPASVSVQSGHLRLRSERNKLRHLTSRLNENPQPLKSQKITETIFNPSFVICKPFKPNIQGASQSLPRHKRCACPRSSRHANRAAVDPCPRGRWSLPCGAVSWSVVIASSFFLQVWTSMICTCFMVVGSSIRTNCLYCSCFYAGSAGLTCHDVQSFEQGCSTWSTPGKMEPSLNPQNSIILSKSSIFRGKGEPNSYQRKHPGEADPKQREAILEAINMFGSTSVMSHIRMVPSNEAVKNSSLLRGQKPLCSGSLKVSGEQLVSGFLISPCCHCCLSDFHASVAA